MQSGSPIPNTTALIPITAKPNAVMVRGAGSWLWDEQGRAYLDLIQGWAVNCLGHSPPALAKALAEQASTLWNPSPAFHNARQRDFAQALVSHCDLDQVFFCNSGAEANEGAVKLARKWGALHRGGAARILTTEGSFHGRTLAMMAASGKPGFADRFPPRVEGFTHVPFGDLDAIDRALEPDVAAVMVEPIQGEAGVVVPPSGYLAGLRQRCDRAGALLILDEIQTGMGRTGPLFAHQREGVVPDIMTLGKGMGGGAPLAALLCRDAVSCFEPGDQGGTFNGNPLMCAVGHAVLDAITAPDLQRQAKGSADELERQLQGMVDAGLAASRRGAGLLQALVLATPTAPEIAAKCFEAGLLINAPRPNVIRLMPALNTTEQDLSLGLERLQACLRAPSQTA